MGRKSFKNVGHFVKKLFKSVDDDQRCVEIDYDEKIKSKEESCDIKGSDGSHWRISTEDGDTSIGRVLHVGKSTDDHVIHGNETGQASEQKDVLGQQDSLRSVWDFLQHVGLGDDKGQ